MRLYGLGKFRNDETTIMLHGNRLGNGDISISYAHFVAGRPLVT